MSIWPNGVDFVCHWRPPKYMINRKTSIGGQPVRNHASFRTGWPPLNLSRNELGGRPPVAHGNSDYFIPLNSYEFLNL